MPQEPNVRSKRSPQRVLSKPFKSPLKRSHDYSQHGDERTVPQGSNDLSAPATAFGVPDIASSSAAKTTASHPTLTRRIRSLRSDIDVISQAASLLTPKHSGGGIETGATELEDEKLARLITKWRSVARDAAEELFADTTERISSMGGMKAWRQQEADRQQRMMEWRKEDEVAEQAARVKADDGSESLSEASDEETEEMKGLGRSEREEVKAMRKQAKQEAKEAAKEMASRKLDNDDEGKKEELTEAMTDGEEGDFTMATMLKTLGIDFSVVGWDASADRWIE